VALLSVRPTAPDGRHRCTLVSTCVPIFWVLCVFILLASGGGEGLLGPSAPRATAHWDWVAARSMTRGCGPVRLTARTSPLSDHDVPHGQPQDPRVAPTLPPDPSTGTGAPEVMDPGVPKPTLSPAVGITAPPQQVPRGGPLTSPERDADLHRRIHQLSHRGSVPIEVLSAAHTNLTRAEGLLQSQRYDAAESVLMAVRRALPADSTLAGRATLELGATLDAQGRYTEAADLYRSLLAHPDPNVSRQALRFSRRFEALRTLRYPKLSLITRMWRPGGVPALPRNFIPGDTAAVTAYAATPTDLRLARTTLRAAYVALSALFLVPVGMVACLSTAPL